MPNSNAIAASPFVSRRHSKVDEAPMPAKKGRRSVAIVTAASSNELGGHPVKRGRLLSLTLKYSAQLQVAGCY
jgi:hypothetical protein